MDLHIFPSRLVVQVVQRASENLQMYIGKSLKLCLLNNNAIRCNNYCLRL